MGSFNITIPRSERPFAEIVSRVPRVFRDQAEKGFVVLAEVGKQHYAEILKAVVIALESKKAPLENLEKYLNLSKNDLSALFAAAMLTVPILGEGGNAEEFISTAVKVGLLTQNLVPKIQPFIDTVVAERAQIGRAIRRAALPALVLPFLSNFEVAVDLRMGFEQEAVVDAVSVAVVHIDTDVNGKEIWFQASKQQMEELKSDIEDAIKRMDTAEAWGVRESKA
jgi:hypothetical protein